MCLRMIHYVCVQYKRACVLVCVASERDVMMSAAVLSGPSALCAHRGVRRVNGDRIVSRMRAPCVESVFIKNFAAASGRSRCEVQNLFSVWTA